MSYVSQFICFLSPIHVTNYVICICTKVSLLLLGHVAQSLCLKNCSELGPRARFMQASTISSTQTLKLPVT